jgi:SAM-dependent MidA family methyltransferase
MAHTLKQSNALSDIIRQEIAKHNAPFAFSNFMQLALYHPLFGYYNREAFTLGKLGDFTTAPEISPLFAHCFARQSLQVFEQLGGGDVLELGAGTGRFASDFLLECERLTALPKHYYIYEISLSLRKKQQAFLRSTCPALFERILWLDALPIHFEGVIIANEVLDALPVHCFLIQEKRIKERCVAEKETHFVWQITEATSEELTEKAEKIRELYALSNDYASEINTNLPPFVQAVSRSLKQGLILFADYGYGQAEYYHPERRKGTLTCFYQHKQHDDPLILPGQQDITAHVDFTSVIESAAQEDCELAGYTSQAAFLLASGLMEEAHRIESSLSIVEAFRLHQAIKQLTLPMEMGERVKIMGLSKNMEGLLLGFKLQDRRRDL